MNFTVGALERSGGGSLHPCCHTNTGPDWVRREAEVLRWDCCVTNSQQNYGEEWRRRLISMCLISSDRNGRPVALATAKRQLSHRLCPVRTAHDILYQHRIATQHSEPQETQTSRATPQPPPAPLQRTTDELNHTFSYPRALIYPGLSRQHRLSPLSQPLPSHSVSLVHPST